MKYLFSLVVSVLLLLGVGSCRKAKSIAENPFFEEQWDTPYGIPPFDRIDIAHFKPAFEEGMALHKAEIDSIVASAEAPTFDNVILAYDNSGLMLSRVERVFDLLNSAHTSDKMQALSAEIMPLLSSHRDAIAMNDGLFAKVKSVYDNRKAMKLTPEQNRLTELLYESFVRSGALLAEDGKARLKEINERLSALSVSFAKNLLAEKQLHS